MKIYTKQGDQGSTSLFGGKKISKDHLRVEAYGTVDEFNAFIGLLISKLPGEYRRTELINAQHILFNIGSNLANDTQKFESPKVTKDHIEALELAIDDMQASLPELRNFILPGGNEIVSVCHVCRTICRRAERRTVSVAAEFNIDVNIVKYLNRFSDYLFVFSRLLSLKMGSSEIHWSKEI